MIGVLVTGTDTGVGKTIVSAAIAAVWRDAGRAVIYVKPIQSGAADGDDDGADVRALTGVETVTGITLGEGLAPAVAARRAGATVTGEELAATIAGAGADDRHVIVEGAGGLLVELATDGTTCADLAARAHLPLVVVARPGLGTLNHTALTLAELDRRGLPAQVVVCGYPPDPDVATATNLAELQRLSGGRLAGVIPRLARLDASALADAGTWLGPALGGTWRLP